ncbi:MAG: GDP-mannose 4,6-dehydratase [Acidobacteriia bacterium]|nr:GDP-mannose 4,6-dehydratase [Terriglobia bacterium]
MPGAILVTGAAGFAGGHLLELLSRDATRAANRDEIVAWHRPEGAPPRWTTSSPGVRWDAVDLLDRRAVEDAVARLRPRAVYHCAGAAHVGRAWDSTEATFAINVRGTHHLLDGLERAGVDARVLIPSSAMVYAPADEPQTERHPLRPSSPYGVSKLAQEMLGMRAHGPVSVMIARAFNHMGPRQDPDFAASGFARRIADIEKGRWQPEISVGNLEARRDLTDVRDTVRAYRLILERGQPGRPYNVCSGRAITIRHLLDLLVARARVPVTVRVDPARLRPNDTPLLVGDPGRLRDELGWRPEISLERTLDDLLEYWREETEKGKVKTEK